MVTQEGMTTGRHPPYSCCHLTFTYCLYRHFTTCYSDIQSIPPTNALKYRTKLRKRFCRIKAVKATNTNTHNERCFRSKPGGEPSLHLPSIQRVNTQSLWDKWGLIKTRMKHWGVKDCSIVFVIKTWLTSLIWIPWCCILSRTWISWSPSFLIPGTAFPSIKHSPNPLP